MSEFDDPEKPFAQDVTAVNGFAYGVIGADIHVFGSGLPLYLLANWQAEPKADREWLRQQPSRMLNARRAVVPFTGRDGELAQLVQWRDSSRRLAVRWLHAPGGQGKTRLAAKLAEDSAAAGWKVIAAFDGPGADRPEAGSQDMTLRGAAGLLVIVDYADRWLLTNLTWLFKNALLHQAGVATRVLMVARTADAWPRIHAILDARQADVSRQSLPALPAGSGERADMFTTARDSFAAIYRLAGSARIGVPGHLTGDDFGLILAVHLAALAAVDARARGTEAPPDMAGLTMYLLNREQLHWGRLYNDGASAAEAGNAYRTPPAVMNQAVFVAALTGTLSRVAGTAVLEDLQLPDTGQILADHAVCYPPADPGSTVLEPLYPDRLAEDFLALTMPGHDADYPGQEWAATTSAVVLARRDERRAAAWTPRAVTFMASAAHRWPHLSREFLYPLLLGDPQLAVDAGSAALTAIASLPAIPLALLKAVESRFPDRRHVDLDPGMAAVTRRLADHRLARTRDAAEAAGIRYTLGIRLSYAGLHDEGRQVTEKAVQAYRELAATEPAAGPRLADSLDNLGVLLWELGQREESLAATEEAVLMYRRLAAADPAMFEAGLARSLSNLGVRLWGLGQRDGAVSAAEEAVQIRRRLAAASPGAFEAGLAASMDNLGVWLSETGRWTQALHATEEAVRIRRRLAAASPAAHEPGLATSLSNLGIRLWGVGKHGEALTPTEEAVQIRRRLAAASPAAFEPDLAASLDNWGLRLSEIGRWAQALAATEEAVRIRRRLAAASPAAHEPDLARSLSNLGVRLSELGRPEEALAAAQEAVRIRRRLAAASPAAFEADLAGSLSDLGVWLSELGRPEEALAATEEAVRIRRRLAAASPAAHEPGLADALTNLGGRLWASGRHEDALIPAEEAARIFRRLVETSLRFESSLAGALDNCGVFLSAAGRWQDAVAVGEEAVQIRRRLAAGNPGKFLPDLALSLSNLAVRLSGLGQHHDALACSEEAVRTYRRPTAANPAAFEPGMARSLSVCASIRVSQHIDPEAALSMAKESAEIYERCTARSGGQFRRELHAALGVGADAAAQLGRNDAAATVRRLADQGALEDAVVSLRGIRSAG